MDAHDRWLDQVREEPLWPELEICDPHHHLWDYPDSRYRAEELLADIAGGHRVTQTVFVECGSDYRSDGPEPLRPVGETEFVDRIARSSPPSDTEVCPGIVGFADLAAGEAAREVLEAHLAASPRFRGIRHASAFDPSDAIRRSHTRPPQGLLGLDAFRRGFAQLEPLGLSFDAWLYHPQIPELTGLARAFPETAIVLDHLGGPLGIGPYAGKREQVFEDWRAAIRELARCPNVVVKLGGLAMPINGFGWHKRDRPPGSEELAEAQRPWHLECIERFGPERCMFESNFPVDRRSCSYTVLWNAFKRVSEGFSDDERAALFRETARRVYRLSP